MNYENWVIILSLQLVTPIVVGVMGWLLRNAVSGFERRITTIEADIKAMGQVMIDQKVVHERLNRVREDFSTFQTAQVVSHNEWRTWVRERFDRAREDQEATTVRVAIIEKLMNGRPKVA